MTSEYLLSVTGLVLLSTVITEVLPIGFILRRAVFTQLRTSPALKRCLYPPFPQISLIA